MKELAEIRIALNRIRNKMSFEQKMFEIAEEKGNEKGKEYHSIKIVALKEVYQLIDTI